MQTQFRRCVCVCVCMCVSVVKQMNFYVGFSLLGCFLSAARSLQSSPPSNIEFWFRNENSTPINFACKLSLAKLWKNSFFPVVAQTSSKKPIMLNKGRKILFVSHSLPSSTTDCSPRRNRILRARTHTHTISYPLKSQGVWCQLPAERQLLAVWKPRGGETHVNQFTFHHQFA